MASEPAGPLPVTGVREAVRLAVAIPAVVIAILCVLLAWQVASLTAHNRWVAQTDAVIASTWRVTKLLIDQETGLRARLLAGDDAFLYPYTTGRAAFPEALEELRGLVADNTPQQARLDELRSRYETWRRNAEETLARARREGVPGPAVREGMQARKVEMDAMRGVIDTVLAEESRLLAERQRAARETTRRVFEWGGAAALVLALVAALLLHRLFRSLDRAYAEAFRAQAEALRTSAALAAEVTEQLRLAETALLESRRQG